MDDNWQRKLSGIVRIQISNALRDNVFRGRQKFGEREESLEKLLGCSLCKLAIHLQANFIEGMSWENFGKGKGKWGLDHIKPLAAHDLSDMEEQKKAFHYLNLRPMWHDSNASKGSLHDGRRWHHTDHALQPETVATQSQ